MIEQDKDLVVDAEIRDADKGDDVTDAEFEVEAESLEDHFNPLTIISSTSSTSSTCSS